jgi:nitroreductase
MDARDALLGRRTPSHWAPDPVDPAVLDRALQAAHRAPCHRHTWPWRFLVVGPATRARLADVAVAVKAKGGELPAAQVEAIRRGSLDPAALIVVARVEHPDPFRAREDYAAVACAVENLMLSAWADGVASKWGTGAVTRAAETYAVLGLDPAVTPIEGFLWLGHPARFPDVQRPPLDDVVRRLP